MKTEITTIELPRIEGESARAFAAKVEYITMGEARSLEKLRQKIGNRSVRYLEQWSTKFDWSSTAAGWDNQQAAAALQSAADAYQRDLEAHRKRAMDNSRDLLALTNGLKRVMADALQQPRQVKGADGHTYTLHKIMADASTLTTISKGMQVALDLEAHALSVERMMERLADDSE